MKSATSKFLASVFVLTLICALLQLIWNNQSPEKMHLHNGFWLLGIFATTVTVVHFLLLNSKAAGGNSFVRVFMVSTTLKFLFYLMVLVLFMFFSSDNKQALALHFLFYYLAFNILEVTMLYRDIRK